MPKPGFKSITVSENVYKKFFEVYEKNKKGLELKGITSFSGYLTSMMEEMMIKDAITCISTEQDLWWLGLGKVLVSSYPTFMFRFKRRRCMVVV